MISPPFLELGFYFGDMNTNEALQHVSTWLIKRGCEPSVSGAEQPTPGTFRITFTSNSQATGVLAECLLSASRAAERTSEDTRPIVISCDGSQFEKAALDPTFDIEELGREVVALFKDAVAYLSPTYASLTFEYGLESPSELQLDARSYAFKDCYISQQFLDRSILEKIVEQAEGAVCGLSCNGLFLFCNEAFAQRKTTIGPEEANSLSEYIARLIAQSESA